MQTTAFEFKAMIMQGWPILSVLLVCSIVSLAVIWDRWKAFAKAARNMTHVLSQIASRISHASNLQEKERIAANEIARWTAPLEEKLSILGTIASTTPFIGLLGTVVGIIRAFRAVSASMGGGPSVVANGIAEALIATAFGLLVAIPAVMGFNYFNSRLQRMEQKLQIDAADILNGIKK